MAVVAALEALGHSFRKRLRTKTKPAKDYKQGAELADQILTSLRKARPGTPDGARPVLLALVNLGIKPVKILSMFRNYDTSMSGLDVEAHIVPDVQWLRRVRTGANPRPAPSSNMHSPPVCVTPMWLCGSCGCCFVFAGVVLLMMCEFVLRIYYFVVCIFCGLASCFD